MPAAMTAAAASNHVWISCANSSAPESLWPSFFVRADGITIGKLRRNRSGVLISTLDTDEQLYDSTAAWRDRAMNGVLHSARHGRYGSADGSTVSRSLHEYPSGTLSRVTMRVLFTTPAGLGHIHPMVPLARAMVARGHDVMWAVPADGVGHVERTGIRAVATGPAGLPGPAEVRRRYPELGALSLT